MTKSSLRLSLAPATEVKSYCHRGILSLSHRRSCSAGTYVCRIARTAWSTALCHDLLRRRPDLLHWHTLRLNITQFNRNILAQQNSGVSFGTRLSSIIDSFFAFSQLQTLQHLNPLLYLLGLIESCFDRPRLEALLSLDCFRKDSPPIQWRNVPRSPFTY